MSERPTGRGGRRGGKREQGTPDPPPMLVLGDSGPVVEDTTAQELARRAEELERQRVESEKEVERLRQQTEKDLRARQAAVDRAERELLRTERRLRREATRVGRGHMVPRTSTASTASALKPLEALARRIRVGVLTLAGFAVLSAVLTSLAVASSGRDAEGFETVRNISSAQVSWLTAGMTLDQELLAHLAGEDLPDELESTAAARQAVQAYPGRSGATYLERWERDTATMLGDSSTSQVRALNAWDGLRPTSIYTVPGYAVRDAVQELSSGDGVVVGCAVLTAVLLISLLVLVRQERETAPLVMLTLALLLVGVLAWMGMNPHKDQLEEYAAGHQAALSELEDVFEQQGDDLGAAFGLLSSYYGSVEDFWDREPLRSQEGPVFETYREARTALGEVATGQGSTSEPDDLLSAANALTEAGQAAFDEATVKVEASRERVLSVADAPDRVHPRIPQTLGVITPVLILAAAGWRYAALPFRRKTI